MWIQTALAIAVFCNIFGFASAWSIDEGSCAGPTRTQNIKDVIEYVMQWPNNVDKYLGNDNQVNDYAKRLFDQRDWNEVKSVVKAVGAMGKEDSSRKDPMDPIIYCGLARMKPIKSVTDPSKTRMKDTKHDIFLGEDLIDDCQKTGGKTLAFTANYIDQNKKRNTYIQLCPRFLKQVGQGLTIDADGNIDAKKLQVSISFMNQMRKSPLHIDNFAPLPMTVFHEFVHTWKVHIPQINDTGLYYWDTLTKIKDRKVALDTADSYAYVSMGTWILSKFGGTSISKDGKVRWDDEDELGKRDRVVGLSWFA